jgi:hypothetical protein
MGLHYEQQRSDAKDYVGFNCRALKGYDAARDHIRRVGDGESAFTPGMDMKAKLDLVLELMLPPFMH